MLERIRTIDNRILYLNPDKIVAMFPQKNGVYAVRLDGVRRTSVILINRREAEKLTGDVFSPDDPVDAVALPVTF